jgi:molybdopterin-guanine dinucleotide biosynthesis protein MobB
MVPAIAIVGESGTGKTNLIERLIVEFKKRGMRVATVKHSHGKIDLDKEGKDTWRFAEAGSDITVVSSVDKLAYIRNVDSDSSIAEILRMIGGSVDLVLFEGFKKGNIPKIEVYREQSGSELACPPQILSAVVTDKHLDINLPQIPLDDTAQVADFIERNILNLQGADSILFINGKQVFIKPFVQDIISEALLAMVATLKDVDEIRNLDISIRKN